MPGGYGLVLGGLSLSFPTVLSLTLQCGPPCETVTTCDDKGVWPPDPQNGLSNSHAFETFFCRKKKKNGSFTHAILGKAKWTGPGKVNYHVSQRPVPL